MKKLISIAVGLFAMFAMMPAQALLPATYQFVGSFTHLGPDPDDPGGDPIIIDSQQLSIFGIADNSIAPSTGSFASLDGELAFDYSKFALSSLIVQTDPDLDPEVLEGSDYFFFAAPTVAIGGFGKGNTLLFGGDLYELCGCSFGYDGTYDALAYLEGGSFDAPFTFGGADHNYDYIFGFLLAGDPFSAFVPEPASWALMLLGFGATGAAMRRRRARVPLAA